MYKSLLISVFMVFCFHTARSQAASEQAIGAYAHGTLVNPSQLPLQGPGFVKVLQPRHRFYGSRELIDLIQSISEQIFRSFPNGERLQIGDIAARGGGEISGHASHQNGLDVDIVYFRTNRVEQDTQSIDGFKEVFVQEGRISKNFDRERNWRLLSAFVHSGAVSRIFMDPVIKVALCHYSKKHGDSRAREEVLRRLRPLAHHADHFHLRIACPAHSSRCDRQDDPPHGDGCTEAYAESRQMYDR